MSTEMQSNCEADVKSYKPLLYDGILLWDNAAQESVLKCPNA